MITVNVFGRLSNTFISKVHLYYLIINTCLVKIKSNLCETEISVGKERSIHLHFKKSVVYDYLKGYMDVCCRLILILQNNYKS